MPHEPAIGEILVQQSDLEHRVQALGAEISRDYEGKDLLLVGVLKGAVFFLADLMRHIDVPCEVDFMAVASYGSATESSGVVRILKDLDMAIEGRDVLIVEVIVDSGLTLQSLPRSRSAHCSRSPRGARSICPRATSASRSRTSSRSATGSTTRSSTGIFPTSQRSARGSDPVVRGSRTPHRVAPPPLICR
jgi:hypoxanthine phosphoribosyltransferase